MRVEPLPVSDGLLPGYFRVAARISYEKRGLKPEVLWFDLPEAYRKDVSEAANGWLIALLPLAPRMAEPLRLDAPVDPTLLRNAGEILRIWSTWDPLLKPIPIETCGEPDAVGPGAGRTGLFFSGGVDSFFSVLHWDEVRCAQGTAGVRPVDDLIFVWGYDIPLKHRRAFVRKREALAEVARQLGKNLIPMATNLRETRLGELAWGPVLHGAALGAAGLMLDVRFSRLLVSSAFQRTILEPWGSHPHVDPLMSTRRTEFIYYGDAFDRYEKTAFIVRSEVALRHLHVCWGAGSDDNCGQCEKCYRTLLSLELLGVRDQAASFPRDRFSLEQVPSIRLGTAVAMKLLAEVRDRAVQVGRWDVASAIEECLANNAATGLEKKLPRWRRMLREVREGVRSRLLFM